MYNEMDKFYRTKAFFDLNKEWKAKLSEAGFTDLERGPTEYSELPPSVNVHTSRFKTREVTEEYFDLALEYLSHGKFKNTTQRHLWELHCQGLSLAEIAKEMKLGKSTVFYHVKLIKRRMKRA